VAAVSHRVLNPEQFFHGSPHLFEPGQILDPQEHPHKAKWGDLDPSRYTYHFYFAGTKEEPINYGRYLYQVEPLGEYEPDPALAHIPELRSFRTKHPVRVVRHVRP
jgi:hypothetical protein